MLVRLKHGRGQVRCLDSRGEQVILNPGDTADLPITSGPLKGLADEGAFEVIGRNSNVPWVVTSSGPEEVQEDSQEKPVKPVRRLKYKRK